MERNKDMAKDQLNAGPQSFQKQSSRGAKTHRGEILLLIRTRVTGYTEELFKKDLNDPDNHDGMITHLEPDILECEVKWALGSITMNKASGGDRIPVDWLDLLAVQGTLKSILKHHNSKASVLQHSTFLWSNSHIHA